ncbi:C40 family peptidase [Amycolatopsis sp. H20-H5]|uniref:C40 family peptidase n=1 Tax=Amycolatopsis sp. H20-H5 TaxID=3046309 RepID=UPI002DB6BDAA|nr:C40 family peptidase [Amycolatopsis sp. H20-H5]MEC3974393.1 C40 family peptidase [Amycolatopsis sp. H20-H5]
MSPYQRRSPLRATIALAAVLTATLGSLPASAQPTQPPASSQDPLQRYHDLGAQAAKTEEDLLLAQDGLRQQQAARDKANADLETTTEALTQAEDATGRFRGKVDGVAAAALQGDQIGRISALLSSQSRKEFLDKSSALGMLAANDAESLNRLRDATSAATSARAGAADAQKRADDATSAAQTAVDRVQQHKDDLNQQIKEVRQALKLVPSADRKRLGSVQDSGSYLGPPGAANDALQAALSKRGSEYQWGATGPSEFDCSGLTGWAYKQAGVTLPRTSRQQYTAGMPVSTDQLQPGDLLFYDDGSGNPSAIHHVGMFVGNGKMVDAPTEGQLVDVRAMKGDGHLIGARRIVG